MVGRYLDELREQLGRCACPVTDCPGEPEHSAADDPCADDD
jgi:hypothetical protein